MSTFQILHISDLHINSKENFDRSVVLDPILERVKKDRKEGISPEIVVVTGDLAYSGTKEEYDHAKIFFDDLLSALDLPDERLFIVPGNHDVDHNKYRKSDFLSYEDEKELNDELEDAASRKDLLKGMEDYFKFIEINYGHLRNNLDRLVSFVCSYKSNRGKRIGLTGLNSAWMYRRRFYERKIPYSEKIAFEMIAVGEYQVDSAIKELRNGGSHDLIINILHHPIEWLKPEDRKKCSRYFDGTVLLSGHLHDVEGRYIHDLDSKYYQFQAGTVYSGSNYPNRYQYITFDWGTDKINLTFRKFVPDKRKWIVDSETGDNGKKIFDLTFSDRKEEDTLIAINEDMTFEKYLQAALNEHRHLPTKGFETTLRVPIELENVYINMHAHIHFQEFDMTLKGRERIEERIREENLSSLDIKAAFEASDRHKIKDIVILGDPGSGKTTLLKYILIILIQGKGREKLGIVQGLIPFLAPLRDLKDPDKEGFHDFIKRTCCLKDYSISDKNLADLLESGRSIILLDGLDEVSNENLRIKTCKWIDKARRKLPNTRFVITSRFAGYSEKSRLEGNLLELSIKDFTPDEVKEFLTRWFETVEITLHPEGDEDRWKKKGHEEAIKLIERINIAEHLRKLAVNPLILQIIALVHRDRGTLPQRRVELYEECINVLLEKWDMAKGLDVLLSAREARQILQPLALWLHDKEERRYASMGEIKKQIKEPLETIGKSNIDSAELLLNIRDRSGIFMGYSESEFGFTHLSFQEYLSAEEIRNKRRFEILISNYGNKWWKEVTLLSLALNNPSIIEEFMEMVIISDKIYKDANLLIDAINDSIIKPSQPFIKAIKNDKLSHENRFIAIRMLRAIGGDKGIKALKEAVDQYVDINISSSAFDALESLGKIEGIRKPFVEEFVNPVDSSEMVLVPAGTFLYGSREDDEMASSDEKPQRIVELPAYYMDKFPIYNEQYCKFLNDKKPDEKTLNKWINLEGEYGNVKCRISKAGKKYSVKKGYEKHPVIYVSWFGANAYAEWARKKLPTEQEWEKAARGTDGRRYPWGDEFDTNRCNTWELKIENTTPVNKFTDGVSPYGCQDMAGNVFEWTDDWYDKDKKNKVLRGGSWDDGQQFARCADRSGYDPDTSFNSVGFRCARTLKK